MNAEVSEQMPSRVDGHCPDGKAHVHTASLSEQSQRLQSVAESLPSGLSTADEGSIADNLLIALGDVVNDEVPSTMLLAQDPRRKRTGRKLTKTNS